MTDETKTIIVVAITYAVFIWAILTLNADNRRLKEENRQVRRAHEMVVEDYQKLAAEIGVDNDTL